MFSLYHYRKLAWNLGSDFLSSHYSCDQGEIDNAIGTDYRAATKMSNLTLFSQIFSSDYEFVIHVCHYTFRCSIGSTVYSVKFNNDEATTVDNITPINDISTLGMVAYRYVSEEYVNE